MWVYILWYGVLFENIYIYIYICHHYHHHHVVLVARISLTLSRYISLSFIASSRSSRQHPVSSHSCWLYVRAGRPAFARPCVGFHKSTSLMISSLLLQQCPACLVRLTWIVFLIGGRWPYSWCLVGCCRQDLFKIAKNTASNLEKKYIYIVIHRQTVSLYHHSSVWLDTQDFTLDLLSNRSAISVKYVSSRILIY